MLHILEAKKKMKTKFGIKTEQTCLSIENGMEHGDTPRAGGREASPLLSSGLNIQTVDLRAACTMEESLGRPCASQTPGVVS